MINHLLLKDDCSVDLLQLLSGAVIDCITFLSVKYTKETFVLKFPNLKRSVCLVCVHLR
jgi:hypothetical protein